MKLREFIRTIGLRKMLPAFAALAAVAFGGCVEALTDAPDRLAPEISIYSPKNNDTVYTNKEFEIVYSASDDQNIRFFELYINDQMIRNYTAGDAANSQVSHNAQVSIKVKLDSAWAGKTISYYLKAYDKANATKSNVMTGIYVKQVGGTTGLPLAPKNLKLETLSMTSVNLTWEDSPNELYYQLLRRREDSQSFDTVDVLQQNSITANNYGLDPNATYYYKLRAVNNAGYAESGTVKRQGAEGIATPIGFKAEAIGSTRINLSWIDNSTEEIVFKIQRKIAGSSEYTKTILVDKNSASWTDKDGLVTSTQYTYRIAAQGATKLSAWSDEVTVSTLRYDIGVPSNLQAGYNSTSQKVELSWTNNNGNFESEIRIERKAAAGGVYAEIAKKPVSTVSFADEGLASGKYYYRIRYYTVDGYFSQYSEETSVTVP